MSGRATHPTSIRLSAAEVDLLDAWAQYLSAKRVRPAGRTEVIAMLLRRAAAPGELSPEARAVRVALERATKLET